jgi:hypothetical protein
MSQVSQTPFVTVMFDPSIKIRPLTVPEKSMADDIERYLQRVVPGSLAVSLNEHLGLGFVRQSRRTVATFSFAPFGGAS